MNQQSINSTEEIQPIPIRNSISNIPTNQPIRLQIAPQYCKIIQIKNQQLRNQPSKQ
jgi:hypothetical protein